MRSFNHLQQVDKDRCILCIMSEFKGGWEVNWTLRSDEWYIEMKSRRSIPEEFRQGIMDVVSKTLRSYKMDIFWFPPIGGLLHGFIGDYVCIPMELEVI